MLLFSVYLTVPVFWLDYLFKRKHYCMSESPPHKHSSHPVRKKIIRVVTIIFMTLLFFEFLVYFGSNIFLSKWAERKINEATKDVYLIEFNRFNFSLLRRGVFLDGIIMKPIPGKIVPEDQVLFDFSLDQLAVRGLWYSFFDGVLYVGKIEFDNPDVKMDFPGTADSVAGVKNKNKAGAPAGKKQSAVKALEEEIQKSIRRLNFNALFINEIEISHADLFFLDFLSQNSIKAKNTRLVIKDIDWTTKEIWRTPFNAQGFEFDLERVDFPLPDGVHSLYANEVFISSLDKRIEINAFKLTSNKSRESKSYYEVTLEELRVGNVDLNKAFMTSEVEIDELILNAPEFKVERREKVNRDSAATGDLNELIYGILKSIQIKELAINNGKFIKNDFLDTLKNRIDIAGLDFKMVNFYLGENESKKVNQFFYGEDASMEIRDARLYLADEVHVLSGEKVMVSSFKDEILIENFSILSREESLLIKNPKSLIQLSLPEFSLEAVNLKKLYNEGILEIGEMKLLSPQIEYTELTNVRKPGENSSDTDLLKGLLTSVAIKRFDLQNGVVQFKNEAGVRSNDIEFEKFSLLLENIFLQPGVSTKTFNEFLLADEIVLSLDKYRLKLRDNLHEFLADRVLIDSKNSLVEITGFVLRPENQGQIKGTLDAYGKSSTIDLKIPKFRAEGIDLYAAIVDQELTVKHISIPNPELSFSTYRKGKSFGSPQDQLESSKEFENLLTSYFRLIQIDSLNFSDGKIQYRNFSGKEDISFNEDNFSLILRGFLVEKDHLYLKKRTFFSEEIDLSLENYSFSLAGGNYLVETDGLTFNSLAQSLKIDNLVLSPGPNLNSKIALSVTMPSVSLDGIDIETFLFDNELILEQFNVIGGKINLDINPDFKKEDATLKPKTDSTSRLAIRKTIETLKIDQLKLGDSKLNINYRFGNKDVQSIQTDFDLLIKELYLDSANNRGIDNLSELFKSINLNLVDFSFALPDSIHTIQFSNLAFDNLINETLFSDVKIIPKSKTGSPGSTIFEASIDKLGIQNNKLKEIQETGIFDLSQVRLTNPTFDIYVDSEKKSTVKSSSNTVKKDAFVNSLLLQDVLIQNGKFTVHNKEKGPVPQLDFQGFNFEVKDLNFDLLGNTTKLNPQLLFQKELNLSLSDYSIYTKDSLNKLSIGKISFLDRNVVLDKVKFGPTIGRYDYLKRIGFQSDAIDATVERISILGIDFDTYFNSQVLKARKVSLDGMHVDVFRDKRLPRLEGVIKPMPQELMKNAPIEMSVDSVTATNAIIQYQEFAPRAMIPGSIRFEDMDLSLAPFKLSTAGTGSPLEKTFLQATAKLMGKGEVVLNSTLFFEDPYPIDMNVKLGEFDLRSLNSMVSNAVFVEILSGKVRDGDWRFRINKDEAWGEMDFRYQDLKIQLLDTVSMMPGKGKLGLLTFLANTLTRNNNPRKFFNKQVTSTIYFERDKSRFIFGGWWRATFSGLKGSVGFGQPKRPKRKEDSEN